MYFAAFKVNATLWGEEIEAKDHIWAAPLQTGSAAGHHEEIAFASACGCIYTEYTKITGGGVQEPFFGTNPERG